MRSFLRGIAIVCLIVIFVFCAFTTGAFILENI
jgi:hypothetical protein